ncbi:MAG: hypothetical protein ACOVVK_01565 [Elsteraceae bacterium]
MKINELHLWLKVRRPLLRRFGEGVDRIAGAPLALNSPQLA